MRIALLSNINIDPLKNSLEKIEYVISYISGYNRYFLDLLDKESELYKNDPDLIFIIIDLEELGNSQAQTEIGNLLNAVQIYQSIKIDSICIISFTGFMPDTTLTLLDSNSNNSLTENTISIYRMIKLFVSNKHNVLFLDLERLIRKYGTDACIDLKYWYLGRIKYSFDFFNLIANELDIIVNTYKGNSKKVLVLDLDNTLWGGIAGEDGIQGIKLSEEGMGKIYRDFQKSIKKLKSLGFLLAIVSKNNELDALEIINNHKMMVLKENDFIVKKINWENKVQNIIEISKDLNLGLESFVFIDDNPVERENIQSQLPEVSVPDFPSDIVELNKWFLSQVCYKYFSKLHLTAEDQKKHVLYQNNMSRKNEYQKLDPDDFLRKLNIEIDIYKNKNDNIQRIAQLTQKTNQFNFTTKRYTDKDILGFLNSDFHDIYSVLYTDKFGCEGIVAVIILNYSNDEAIIDTFLMSCRVIGRKIEYEILKSIADNISESLSIIKKIKGLYFPTPKNIIVKDVYLKAGFTFENDGEFIADIKTICNLKTDVSNFVNINMEE